jgi:hypothetical protein
VDEVINTDQPGAVRSTYSTAIVANDEIADSCRTILFLKPTMAVAAKETGQIELSDGDEAIAFGEQAIREMKHDSRSPFCSEDRQR